jgi:hypothetical protein
MLSTHPTAQSLAASDACPAPPIGVVIPAYNRPERLFVLRGDLPSPRGAEFEVIAVNDHSPQDPISLPLARSGMAVRRYPANSGSAR